MLNAQRETGTEQRSVKDPDVAMFLRNLRN